MTNNRSSRSNAGQPRKRGRPPTSGKGFHLVPVSPERYDAAKIAHAVLALVRHLNVEKDAAQKEDPDGRA